ncbi:MAG: NIL domain-containing protein [Candidatus Omnitrophota bacterium]|nr:NIL domain-containing protein [Candidatus Omnitrophota bacterium]
MKINIEITVPGQLKHIPIIYYLGHDFKLIPNIIEASFSTEVGWASLVLEGEESEIKKAIEYLKSKKITINLK